jgi:hypothetical protein
MADPRGAKKDLNARAKSQHPLQAASTSAWSSLRQDVRVASLPLFQGDASPQALGWTCFSSKHLGFAIHVLLFKIC